MPASSSTISTVSSPPTAARESPALFAGRAPASCDRETSIVVPRPDSLATVRAAHWSRPQPRGERADDVPRPIGSSCRTVAEVRQRLGFLPFRYPSLTGAVTTDPYSDVSRPHLVDEWGRRRLERQLSDLGHTLRSRSPRRPRAPAPAHRIAQRSRGATASSRSGPAGPSRRLVGRNRSITSSTLESEVARRAPAAVRKRRPSGRAASGARSTAPCIFQQVGLRVRRERGDRSSIGRPAATSCGDCGGDVGEASGEASIDAHRFSRLLDRDARPRPPGLVGSDRHRVARDRCPRGAATTETESRAAARAFGRPTSSAACCGGRVASSGSRQTAEMVRSHVAGSNAKRRARSAPRIVATARLFAEASDESTAAWAAGATRRVRVVGERTSRGVPAVAQLHVLLRSVGLVYAKLCERRCASGSGLRRPAVISTRLEERRATDPSRSAVRRGVGHRTGRDRFPPLAGEAGESDAPTRRAGCRFATLPSWTACDNLLLDTDSYKASHWLQYPPGTDATFFYVESRGGRTSARCSSACRRSSSGTCSARHRRARRRGARLLRGARRAVQRGRLAPHRARARRAPARSHPRRARRQRRAHAPGAGHDRVDRPAGVLAAELPRDPAAARVVPGDGGHDQLAREAGHPRVPAADVRRSGRRAAVQAARLRRARRLEPRVGGPRRRCAPGQLPRHRQRRRRADGARASTARRWPVSRFPRPSTARSPAGAASTRSTPTATCCAASRSRARGSRSSRTATTSTTRSTSTGARPCARRWSDRARP